MAIGKGRPNILAAGPGETKLVVGESLQRFFYDFL
jgi:hypothetical protein